MAWNAGTERILQDGRAGKSLNFPTFRGKIFYKEEKSMKFASTEEALMYGRRASKEEIEELEEKRHAALWLATRARGRGALNEALQHTFSAQFYREAIEAFNSREENNE